MGGGLMQLVAYGVQDVYISRSMPTQLKTEIILSDYVNYMDYVNDYDEYVELEIKLGECPVCYEEKDLVALFGCHYLCKACQNKMAKHKLKCCPLCRNNEVLH